MSHGKKLVCLTAAVILAGPWLPELAAGAEESRSVSTATASVNSMEMYYEVQGRGEPLVLLHGFGGSGEYWRKFARQYGLDQHYQVITPDLRGHGRSTNPSNEFTHRQAALDVYALLDQLGVREFSAMGNSTGGMTLIHMATQQPGRIRRMVLMNATTYFPEQARVVMRGATFESIPPQQMERYRKTHKHGDQQIRALRREFRQFADNYDDMNFTPPYLSTIKAETLIIHGDRDQLFPVKIPLEMYRSIPRSYLWIVPNAGHGATRGKEAQLAETVQEFLRGQWGGRRR